MHTSAMTQFRLTVAPRLGSVVLRHASLHQEQRESAYAWAAGRVRWDVVRLRSLDLSGEIQQSAMHGFVSPRELLVVSGFEFNAGTAKRSEGEFMLGWLPVVDAAISGAIATQTQSSIGVPDLSVAAFKVARFLRGE